MTCRDRRAPAPLIVFATAFLCICLVSGGAIAQQNGKGSRDLYTLIEKAQAHVVAGRWQSAIGVYLDAWKVSRDPGYLYNIAVLYLVRLKDEVKALEYAEKYAEQARSDSEKMEAQGLINRIKENINGTHGKIIVEVMPKTADATIFVDGRPLGEDNWVPAGNHVLGAQAPGYLPFSQEISIVAGTETRLTVSLKTVEGQLAVRCKSGRCSVSVDGEEVGDTPVFRTTSPGEHSVEVVSGGSVVFSDWVTVESGMQKTVTVAVDTGRTEIVSDSAGSDTGISMIDATKKPEVKDAGTTWAKGIETGRKNSRKIGPQKAAAISMWVLSAVAVGTGTAMYFLGQDKLDSAGALKPSDFPRYSWYEWEYDKRLKDGELFAYVGYGSWGLGAAALAAGFALWFTAPKDNPVTLVPAGPDGVGATAIVRW